MTLLNTTNASLCEYLLDNSPVLIFWDEATNEMLIDLTSFALFLGFESVEGMMINDLILDVIGNHIKQSGESPFRSL